MALLSAFQALGGGSHKLVSIGNDFKDVVRLPQVLRQHLFFCSAVKNTELYRIAGFAANLGPDRELGCPA